MSVAHPEPAAVRLARPTLRLLAAPAAEPPYDDETPRPGLVGPAARLRLAPPVLRLVPPLAVPDRTEDDEDDAAWTRPRTPLAALAPAEPFVQALVQRLLEVLAGVRPVTQLQPDTSPELYARLQVRATRRARAAAAGLRPDTRAVRSVRVQARDEGVAEACATVKRRDPAGVRAVALALRLEGLDGRWCCTELDGLAGL